MDGLDTLDGLDGLDGCETVEKVGFPDTVKSSAEMVAVAMGGYSCIDNTILVIVILPPCKGLARTYNRLQV